MASAASCAVASPRTAATASCTCAKVWTRPIACSSASSVDCTPSESRFTPARRRARSAFQSHALSGLASTVISGSFASR